ncbi:MAG: hypothetical protein KGD59_01505 [Candidatus Heimdallarchaeota archaeon]|nr:hypothetical protein [Candidatus Heimdallarchaeota archaeon]MBY8993196.1 hypothetical protein [Candidatus Heimdallarchaeota archaeon]
MDSPATSDNDKSVKLSNEAIDDILNPIPTDKLIERIALIKEWKKKRPPIGEKQTKRDYFCQHLGNEVSLEIIRNIQTISEHFSIGDFDWNIFCWDKSIARYYPDKIKKRFEDVILKIDSLINIDLLTVDEESQTIFLLLEQWQKEIVADTILSKIEAKIPKYFRIYIVVSKKMLLVQSRTELATKEFLHLFEEAFNVKTSGLRINAMVIREFVKSNPLELTRLVIKVPQEVAGFGGLTELTLVGDDVIKGSKGLMDRHEVSPIDVGPWVGASNAEIDLTVGKAIKTKSIEKILELYELMKDL